MSFYVKIKARKMPATVKSWLEELLNRKILQAEEAMILVTKVASKKDREQFSKKWEADIARRKRRLAHIARKMKQAGMNAADADIVRKGGRVD